MNKILKGDITVNTNITLSIDEFKLVIVDNKLNIIKLNDELLTIEF